MGWGGDPQFVFFSFEDFPFPQTLTEHRTLRKVSDCGWVDGVKPYISDELKPIPREWLKKIMIFAEFPS